MTGRPEVLFRHNSGRKKVSIILIDWNVRESFHSIEYLNRQTTRRDDYELIWVEFYGRKAEPIQQMLGASGRPKLDQWIVLGYPTELVYHKHRAYNAGLLAASGEICVICDSDAMFSPTFIENVIRAFDDLKYVAVHLDQVRNFDRRLYPFSYPTFEEVMGPGAVNWLGNATIGLYYQDDRLHRANYGACFAARRHNLLAIGGADEHLDYLGYCCGPYDLTFRLLNRGGKERWLTNEYLYHTWHPNQNCINTDYSGPHDGRFLSLRSLHARASGQVLPYLANPCISTEIETDPFTNFLHFVAEHPEPSWRADNPPASPTESVYRVENNYRGYDLFAHRNEWFACPTGSEFDPSREDTLCERDEKSIRGLVAAQGLKQKKSLRLPVKMPPAEPLKLNETLNVGRLRGKPDILFRHDSGRKKVSVILTDWNVRDSFHSLEYLNRQTAPRDDYELIWVEFYDRKADPIRQMLGASERPKLDQWIVLGYPAELIYHKHRAYNAGLLAANGDICVICHSDAMYSPTFIENIIRAFDETAYPVLHIDSIRNLDRRFYPFNYPSFEEVTGAGCVNWLGHLTFGLWTEEDRVHHTDYGACLAARRSDLISIGGADEHPDYLGSSGGAHEMSFRLANRGRRERWLTNEYLYQTWNPAQHPSSSYLGPQDGRDLSLRALHSRSSGQIRPVLENPCIRQRDGAERLSRFLEFVAETPEPGWHVHNWSPTPPDFVYRVENDFRGYDLFVYRGEWFAHPVGTPIEDGQDETLWSPDEEGIRLQVIGKSTDYAGPQAPGSVQMFIRNLLAEPIHCLPRRAWRVGGKVIGKLRNKVRKAA